MSNDRKGNYMRRLIFICLLYLTAIPRVAESAPQVISPLQRHARSVALIADSKTYQQTGEAISAYRDAIEKDGLAAYILVDDWANPEAVKSAIITLYNEASQFQGVVLIGDIPVPMISNAQHLTSAFKMNQERFSLKRTSIPSDRFYDDFDLLFDFIRRDTTHSLLFYYSLKPESGQRISKEIYSARIFSGKRDSTRYEHLRDYLHRIAVQKRSIETIDNMLVYTGHGYHSQSLAAWEGETLSLREQFPQLYQPGGQIVNLNYRFERLIKPFLLSQIQKPDLDIALFHAHGLPSAQSISNYPAPKSMQQSVTYIQRSLRNRLRRAQRWGKDLAAAREYFMEKYNIPSAWFEGAFSDSVVLSDSLYTASLDIHTQDVESLKPQPLFIMFDECYNAHFIEPDYIAGNYVMGKGRTIVAVGNTVNVKQDIWADEYLGLLNYGMRIGEWHLRNHYLESHLIGDPFLRFKDLHAKNISRIMYRKQYNLRYWKWTARHADAPLRALAIAQLHAWLGTKYDATLAEIYRNETSCNVRMQVIKCLADSRSQTFEKLLLETVNDPYELVRRISAMWMGKIGHEEYIPSLLEKALRDPSVRVQISARDALEFIGPEIVLAKLQAYLDSLTVPVYQRNVDLVKHHLNHARRWLHTELVPALQNDTLNIKERIGAVRTLRNYNFRQAVKPMIALALDPAEDADLRQKTLESLGWFCYSYKRPEIQQACKEIQKQNNLPAKVAAEALKTANRLREGPNNPITP